MQAIHTRHPRFKDAVLGDLAMEHRQRGEQRPLTSRAVVVFEVLRLVFVTDAFGALILYRLKATCLRRQIPIVPRIAHRGAMAWAQLCIGDPVVLSPGVRFPHGQVVIDGIVEIHSGVEIRPFVTIGLREGVYKGPILGARVRIGTGAKIIGPVTLGEGARVGANAVVVDDVPAGVVVVGVPARPVK
jgi:serine O-acetyltransferase